MFIQKLPTTSQVLYIVIELKNYYFTKTVNDFLHIVATA